MNEYWTHISIDSTGKTRNQEIKVAKDFFLTQISSTGLETESAIQKKLLSFWNQTENSHPAELCLRCFISHQIRKTCQELASKFGINHGFDSHDLFPLVLTDVITAKPSSYISLAQEILQTFDDQRSSLTTWTNRKVKHNSDINKFFLEHGIYLVSDWAILNDTQPKQLTKILGEFHQRSQPEIDFFKQLLTCYHKVYRQERLEFNQTGNRCELPTYKQLERICQLLSLKQSAQEILEQLQILAELLRQYRIYVRGGKFENQSLENLPNYAQDQLLQEDDLTDDSLELETNFLQEYRQEINNTLESSIREVIDEKIKQLQKKNNDKSSQYIKGLYLFSCFKKTMGEIAPEINLKEQYQVTRLLQLKMLRTTIQQKMIQILLKNIQELAKKYTTPEQLSNLNQELTKFLEEEIDTIIKQAEKEALVKDSPPSLFSQKLCKIMDQLRIENCRLG